MSRSPIQVPDETKNRLEEFKAKLHARSLGELIDKLMDAHVANDRQRKIDLEQREKEKQRREREEIYLGEVLRKQLHEFQQSTRLTQPAAAIEFLLANYDGSLDMNKHAFETYIRLRG